MKLFMLPLLRALHARGHEVHAVTSDNSQYGVRVKDLCDPAWTVHEISMAGGISPREDPRAVFELARHFRQQRYTVVHAHMSKCGYLAMIAAWLARVPIRIYHNHGMIFLSRRGVVREIFRRAEQLTCRLATRVLYVSQSTLDAALDYGVCDPDKAGMLAYGSIKGIDTDRFAERAKLREKGRAIRQKLGLSPETVLVGYIGRSVPHKGYDLMVRTWKKYFDGDPSMFLVLLASKPEDMLRVLDAPPTNAFAAGLISNVEEYYGAMDLLALPSDHEGLPYSLLEAAAAELPVVATRIPGNIDGVVDGVTGLLIPQRDEAALAAAIRTLRDRPALRAQYGAAGRARILKQFQPSLILDALVEEYEGLLAERRVPMREEAGPMNAS